MFNRALRDSALLLLGAVLGNALFAPAQPTNHARGFWKFDLFMIASVAAAIYFGGGKATTAARASEASHQNVVEMVHPLECPTWIAKCPSKRDCKPRFTCAADLTRRTK